MPVPNCASDFKIPKSLRKGGTAYASDFLVQSPQAYWSTLSCKINITCSQLHGTQELIRMYRTYFLKFLF